MWEESSEPRRFQMPSLQLVVERVKGGGGGNRKGKGWKKRERRTGGGEKGRRECKGEGWWREVRRDRWDPTVLGCGGNRRTLAFTSQ